jgi:folate-dependent phosphoribosylglycinamide formyltransferase PurN
VHFVDNHYDHGPIISQHVVPVRDDDSPAELAARIFAQECEAYPAAIQAFAEGRLEIRGRQVRVHVSSP